MKLFDDFVVGASLGNVEDSVDAVFRREWAAVFPDESEAPNPGGAVMALYMRAYMAVLPVRPPGNIHARQRVQLMAAIPVDTKLHTEIVCRSKELKGDRRWVTLMGTLRSSTGETLAEAEMTTLWAK